MLSPTVFSQRTLRFVLRLPGLNTIGAQADRTGSLLL
jgi:hypothetical protein